ncbi:MAG TPA: hypothetical protein DCZ94_17575 [Lentisphaeria bacterium]|nr:MAG: hypothetical protein A2X48_13235 [Lentisphaerae bacterium GWF2_49_21]HBC88755.1 hypothetical protein [Lentisphaeria bacterium]
MNKLTAMIGICVLAVLAIIVQAQDKTFKVDDEGYIHNWLALPAIELGADVGDHSEATQKQYFEKEYFAKQKTVTPAENDKVTVDGKELAWKAYQIEDPCWKFDPPTDNSICFVVAYVIADEEIANVSLSIGSDDSSLWTVNGAEAIKIYAGRAVERDTDKSQPLTLKKGVNVIMAMVINGGGEAGVCARFVDKDGNAVKNLKVAIAPVK